MQKITELTSEQEQAMLVHRDKWLAIGLATGPANVDVLRPVFDRFYSHIGKPPAKNIIRVASPLSANVLINMFDNLSSVGDSVRASVMASVWASVGDSVRASVMASVRDSVWASVVDSVRASVMDNVWDSVGDSVWASVGDSVRASVMDSVWDSVWASVVDSVRDSVMASVWASVVDSVRDSVRDSVWDSVRDSVRDSVGASVWSSVRASVMDSVRDSNLQHIHCRLFGHHDAHWIAFYYYFIQHLGVNVDDKHGSIMDDWQTIAENCGWWYPFEDVIIVCDRPTSIHLDERGRLHNATGAALLYADGFCIYSYHGVRMPADVIDDHTTITPERIQAERNAEVQRVMIELYGYEAYVRDSQAIELHRDDYGILYKIPTAGDPIIVVNVTCPSTNGLYWLSVPEYIDSDLDPSTSWGGEKITTAHQAVAWTWGLTAEQYHPMIES